MISRFIFSFAIVLFKALSVFGEGIEKINYKYQVCGYLRQKSQRSCNNIFNQQDTVLFHTSNLGPSLALAPRGIRNNFRDLPIPDIARFHIFVHGVYFTTCYVFKDENRVEDSQNKPEHGIHISLNNVHTNKNQMSHQLLILLR